MIKLPNYIRNQIKNSLNNRTRSKYMDPEILDDVCNDDENKELDISSPVRIEWRTHLTSIILSLFSIYICKSSLSVPF